MHSLVYPTERCNLNCSYCDTEEERRHLIKELNKIKPQVEELIKKILLQ